jgi:hypothetical protein
MLSRKAMLGFILIATSFGLHSPVGAQDQSLAYARVLPADLKWAPLPVMPKGAQSVILHGNPGKPGLFTMRVKVPANYKVPVHAHPDERVRTIISGTYYSAVGDNVTPRNSWLSLRERSRTCRPKPGSFLKREMKRLCLRSLVSAQLASTI